MSQELQQIRLEIWKKQRDLSSLRWKKRNPDKVKTYQDNYRKTHRDELNKKAAIRRQKFGHIINARRRENYAKKKMSM